MKSYAKTNQRVREMYQEYQKEKYQREAKERAFLGRMGFKLIQPKQVIIPSHLRLKGFNSSYLQLFGRPKKLAKWGYRVESDIPGKVKVIK